MEQLNIHGLAAGQGSRWIIKLGGPVRREILFISGGGVLFFPVKRMIGFFLVVEARAGGRHCC